MDDTRAVDNSAWDGPAAMSRCANADDPAACYRAIAAGRRAGDPALQSSWALPHHKAPSDPPNAAGVRNSLSRLPQTQGLTNKSAAQSHLDAHMSAIQSQSASARPPRDNLVRAIFPGVEYREDSTGSGMGTLTGHFAVFNEWTEIDSLFEGRFLERIAPGAFKKTFAENRDGMRVLFQHGKDPQIGDKPLGPIETLSEDDLGAYYEVPLLDTSYNHDLRPGLEANLYGASFRFRVMKEDLDQKPKRSAHNPEGLPERTIRETQVMEFGPVTFPAYAGATAGVRSLTDAWVFDQFTRDPERLVALMDHMLTTRSVAAEDAALSDDGAGPVHSDGESRTEAPAVPPPSTAPSKSPDPPSGSQRKEHKLPPPKVQSPAGGFDDSALDEFRTSLEMVAAIDERREQLQTLDAEHVGRVLPPEKQADWDRLEHEIDTLESRIAATERRRARLERLAPAEDRQEPGDGGRASRWASVTVQPSARDVVWDIAKIRGESRSDPEFRDGLRSNALRAVEQARFAHQGVDQAKVKSHIEGLIAKHDGDDSRVDGPVSRQILMTGNPVYVRAFRNYLQGKALSTAEQNILADTQRALGLGTTGFPVVFQLDPTLVPISNFVVNPWRSLARSVTIAGTNEWKALTSAGITAAYAAEAAEATDNSPTLAQPDIIAERAQAYVPFSIEASQDWPEIETALASDLQDAKDTLEATKFATGAGHGSTEPKGVLTGGTNTTVTTTTGAFVVGDIYKIFEALPPRFRPKAQFAANLFVIDKIRQFDTSGGSGVWVGPMSFGLQTATDAGAAGQTSPFRIPLLGRGVAEASAMGSVLTTGTKILLVGDFSYFVIVDRIGMNIEVDPMVLGTNRRPTGQRAVYAYWRNSSDVMAAAAFQTLVT